jgi:uncharacterized membrane protein
MERGVYSLMKLRIIVIMIALAGLSPRAHGQYEVPPIGTIEIYGNRAMTTAQVRAKLDFKAGDTELPQLDYTRGPLLARALGVDTVLLDGTCCDADGNVLVFVGIDEDGTHRPQFRDAPSGAVRLPDVIYNTFLAYNSAVRAATMGGNPTEDLSAGHALISDAGARREQEKFLGFAADQLDVIRRVLNSSSDENHRAAAAYVIQYAPDKAAVVPDLVDAARDPNISVRTNATRSLAAVAALAASNPELGIRIPPDAFIEMAQSVVYAERMMGVRVLRYLTASRDPEVLSTLGDALPALIEMARWSWASHAYAPYQILGRIVGLSEDEIESTFDDGREAREATIDRAVALLP